MSTPAPLPIGSRLELFVEDTLIERLAGAARLQLHQPVRREVVFRTDAPWEGNACGYPSIVQDGDTVRLYYHGLHYRHSGPPAQARADHAAVMCFAESSDGLHFTRPELGVCEWEGSTANNIVLLPDTAAAVGGDPAHTSTFLDTNPNCPPDQRYKTIIVGKGGMFCLVSPDGIHWSPLSTEPIVTHGAFDSQNLAFWDSVRGEYREYHRGFREADSSVYGQFNGVRDILTAVSPDLAHFPEPRWLEYPGATPEHLYVNQIIPYFRAPHLFVGFPMRYTEGDWRDTVFDLPGVEERMARAAAHPRYGTAVTDCLFMASRDGLTFKRWPEAFLRPGPQQVGSWVYGDNMLAWGMVKTPAAVEYAPDELSFYTVDHYWEGTYAAFRRCTLRVDGFVSVAAPQSGGEVVTPPVVFEGGNLTLNLETSGAGGVQVELQDAASNPLPGYTLADCPAIRGDTLCHVVRWTGTGGDVRPLCGQPVRLRLVLHDADVYAFQFVPYAPEPVRPDIPKV
jgi:hypothetical protein